MQGIGFLIVVHSFTHVRQCIQYKECCCLILDSIQRVELASNMTEDVWEILSSRRKDNPSAFPSVRCSKTHAPSCLAQRRNWSDFRADTGTLLFPDRIQTQHSQTQLHKEENLFFVKGILKSYRCRLARKRWKIWRNRCHLVLAQSDTFAKCASRTRHFHIENSRKPTQWCHNYSLTAATWWTEAPSDCVFPRGNRHLLWDHCTTSVTDTETSEQRCRGESRLHARSCSHVSGSSQTS